MEVQKLTLIRAAGGVYDFWNFEEVYLCNGLSSELENLCIPRKTSREYILLSTFERKTAFLQFVSKNVRETVRFFAVFVYFGGFEGLFGSCDPLHHHPWTGHSPRQQSAHQAVLERPTRSLALSKCRSGAADCGQDMTQSLPLSYLRSHIWLQAARQRKFI